MNWVFLGSGYALALGRHKAITWYNALIVTSSTGNVFPVAGPLWGESTGHRWIPLRKGQLHGPLMFLCCWSDQRVEQKYDWPVIRDAMTVIWCRCYAILLTAPCLGDETIGDKTIVEIRQDLHMETMMLCNPEDIFLISAVSIKLSSLWLS